MLYLYDPINNVKTPTNYELLEGMTGYTESTLISYKYKHRKIKNINCYIIDSKTTKKELRRLMEMEAPKDEIWRVVPELLGKYEISSYGRLRNAETKYLLTPVQNSKGTLGTTMSINGCKKWVRIHRLVAEAFLPQPKGCDSVIHKGSKTNNHVDNLKWIEWNKSLKHNGKCNKIYKPVYKLDMDTYEIIDDYDGIRQAARENFVDKKWLSVAANDITKTCAGFRWCLVENYNNVMKELGI